MRHHRTEGGASWEVTPRVRQGAAPAARVLPSYDLAPSRCARAQLSARGYEDAPFSRTWSRAWCAWSVLPSWVRRGPSHAARRPVVGTDDPAGSPGNTPQRGSDRRRRPGSSSRVCYACGVERHPDERRLVGQRRPDHALRVVRGRPADRHRPRTDGDPRVRDAHDPAAHNGRRWRHERRCRHRLDPRHESSHGGDAHQSHDALAAEPHDARGLPRGVGERRLRSVASSARQRYERRAGERTRRRRHRAGLVRAADGTGRVRRVSACGAKRARGRTRLHHRRRRQAIAFDIDPLGKKRVLDSVP